MYYRQSASVTLRRCRVVRIEDNSALVRVTEATMLEMVTVTTLHHAAHGFSSVSSATSRSQSGCDNPTSASMAAPSKASNEQSANLLLRANRYCAALAG